MHGCPIPVAAAAIAKKVGVGVMRNGDQRRERERERERERLKGDGARVRETIQKEGAEQSRKRVPRRRRKGGKKRSEQLLRLRIRRGLHREGERNYSKLAICRKSERSRSDTD